MSRISETNPLTLKKNDESDEENEFLENTKGFQSRKKSKKKLILASYADDSSEEEKSIAKKEEDDEDMFADLDEDQNEGQDNITKDRTKSSRAFNNNVKSETLEEEDDLEDETDVKFLDVDRFQQELHNDETYDEAKYEDSGSFIQNQRFNEKKKFEDEEDEDDNDDKEIKFTSFGLKEELREGRFDENENFIRYESDNEKDQDEWLKDVKKADIEKARKAQELKLKKEKELQSSAILVTLEPVEQLLFELITFLSASETPMEFFQRLNLEAKKLKTKNNNKTKKRHGKPLLNEQETQQLGEIQNRTTKATGILNALIDKGGFDDVYDLTREELMRKFKYETGEDFKLPTIAQKTQGIKRKIDELDDASNIDKDAKIWQFKWIGKDQVYGPYNAKEIQGWKKTYFKNRALVKKIDDTDDKFINVAHWNAT